MDEIAVESPAEPVKSQSSFRLRLWPGVTLVAVLWLAQVIAKTGEPSPNKFMVGLLMIPFVVIIGLLLWTLFASRLRWSDRILIVGTFAAVTIATIAISGDNFPGMALVMYAVPAVASCWVGWLLLTGGLSWPVRRTGVLVNFVAAGIVCSLLRLDGMDGDFASKFNWRWTSTSEQKLLAELSSTVPVSPTKPVAGQPEIKLDEQSGDWPGFRGPMRDRRVTGVRIKTDWQQSPPKELWRHRVGPGWSSVAVIADRVFTQEQRGEEEDVVCYDANDGHEIWTHRDATRFFEVVAGPGPRATPTYHDGRLYVMGASGKLNCLNAASGELIWSRDIAVDTEAKVPIWGFSSSPLVVDGLVSVFAGAENSKSVIAYHADTGKPAWTSGEGKLSYCSPHLAMLDDVPQILITTEAGLSAFDPATGKVLWHHAWPSKDTARVVQPTLVGSNDVLIGTGMGVGTRRINVELEVDKWIITELWTTRDIKPYYNDLVTVDDHIYGFDGSVFMCVSLKDGSRKWRARGYGSGQVLLLADQALLLIVSEQGDVALVRAQPDQHQEVARFKAIEGKTWNHPVVCQGKLFVRNGEEMACFQLDEETVVADSANSINAVEQPKDDSSESNKE